MAGQTGTQVTATLAGFAAGLQVRDLSDAALQVVRHCLLDWLGCTIAGSSDPVADLLVAEVSEQGGHAQASIIGRGGRVALGQAALINGSVSHVLDYDDAHLGMNGHPSAPVMPAALALGEYLNSGGTDLLAAIAAAMEIECRIGALMGPTHYRRGWNPSGTIGTFGAAAAAGRLLGLDAQGMSTAFGLAATQAAGLQSMIRSQAMPMHSGKAAANGLFAARMAQRGFTATRDALDCHQGFAYTQSESPDPAAALKDLGSHWMLTDTVFKYHVSCFAAHPAIEAMRLLKKRDGVVLPDVASVNVRVSKFISRLCSVMEPNSVIGMKFSLPHNMAMVLADIDTGDVGSFGASRLSDPGLAQTRSAVSVDIDESFSDWRTRVTVQLKGGGTASAEMEMSEPNRDLADQGDRLKRKFLTLAAPVLGSGAAAAIAAQVASLESGTDAADLLRLCVPA